MSGDPAAAAGDSVPAAAATPAATGTATVLNAAGGADEATALNGAGEGGDGGAAQSWRDDWREALAGEDDASLRQLKRFASPENFAKSYRELQKRLSSNQATELPEGATEEEVAAYRKRAGVPEKPEEYGLAFPTDLAIGDREKETLGAFQEYMHKAHAPPGMAKAAFEFYVQNLKLQGEQAKAAAEEATLQNVSQLRAEYKGREFQRNYRIADEFLTKHFGDVDGGMEAVNEILGMRLPSGVQVLNYAPFMRGLFAMARAYADDEALIGGDGGSGGKSIDDEYRALVDKSATAKLTASENSRLMQLSEAKQKREERAGRGRAA